jgi:hypothetical protein
MIDDYLMDDGVYHFPDLPTALAHADVITDEATWTIDDPRARTLADKLLLAFGIE